MRDLGRRAPRLAVVVGTDQLNALIEAAVPPQIGRLDRIINFELARGQPHDRRLPDPAASPDEPNGIAPRGAVIGAESQAQFAPFAFGQEDRLARHRLAASGRYEQHAAAAQFDEIDVAEAIECFALWPFQIPGRVPRGAAIPAQAQRHPGSPFAEPAAVVIPQQNFAVGESLRARVRGGLVGVRHDAIGGGIPLDLRRRAFFAIRGKRSAPERKEREQRKEANAPAKSKEVIHCVEDSR